MTEPSSSRPSPIADAVDIIMQRVATISASPLRATSPFYLYGYENSDKTDGRAPQVRAWPETGDTSQDVGRSAAGQVGNLFILHSDVTFRVWGDNEKQCIDEASLIIKATQSVNLASGSVIPITSLNFEWLNDMGGKSRHGRKLEFSLSIPVAIPNTPQALATITAFVGAFSGSIHSQVPTSGSIGYPISGSWSVWKDDVIVSSSYGQ